MQSKARAPAAHTAPTTEKGTVTARQANHGERRPRQYLTPEEVRLLMDTAKMRGRSRSGWDGAQEHP